MPAHKCLNENVLNEVCKILAYHDTANLTHAQIGDELKRHQIQDLVGSTENKQKRLKKALSNIQAQTGYGNSVLAFIQGVVEPVRFTNRRDVYDEFVAELNKVLIFDSLQIRSDGKLTFVDAAKTLDEAEERASRLRKRLKDRAVHADVLKCCQTELIRDNNYFHTVLEAAKSVAKKLREKSNKLEDGHELVNATLLAVPGVGYPLLAINRYQTSSEQSEQKGFASLVKGMFSMFRNPTAHDPKVDRPVTEEEALEFLVLASLLHRKLDSAYFTGPTPP